MDLPTCPACGQSVLDDDAEDCPFCGASMKTGKPGKAPAAAASAKASSTKGSAGKASPVKGTAGKPSPADVKTKPGRSPFDDDDEDLDLAAATGEDDPFAVDTSASKGAIPLRAAPAKGHGLKVVCPMCETAGYASSKAAGKQVRCANPKCLVPTFMAPAAKVEKPVEAPKPKKPPVSAGALTAVVVILMIAGGGLAAWSLGLFDPKPQKVKELTEEERKALAASIAEADGENGTTKAASPGGDPKTKAADVAEPLDALRKQAFDLIVAEARKEQPERGKAVSRRLAAVAYARTGDMKAAREQIELLILAGKNLAFYPIVPHTAIGWEELQKGQTAAAQAAAKDALEYRSKLPQFGRDPLVISVDLAALLAAVGRMDDAEALVRSREEDVKYGLLSTPLAEVWADRSFDLETALTREPTLPWTAPHWVAVTKILAAHGQWDTALAWSRRHADAEPKTECLVAWADAAAAHAVAAKDSKVLEPLTAAAAELAPAGRARVWAAVASRQAAGKSSDAAASLAKAKEAFASVPAAAEFKLPGMKEIIELEPPKPSAMRSAAQAAAEIGRAEALLGQMEDATRSLDKAMAEARGIGPSLPAIRAKLEACQSAPGSVREQLKTQLKLTGDEQVTRAFNNYRRQCDMLRVVAEQRRDVQARLLAFVRFTPLRDAAWRIVEQSSGSGDPLFETPLPWDLADAFTAAGEKDKAAAVEKAIEGSSGQPAPEQTLRRTVKPLLAEGKAEEAAAAFEASAAEKTWKDRWMLATCVRLVREGKLDTAIALIRGLKKDPIVREEALELTGAFASRIGQGRAVFEAAQQQKGLSPPEKVSLLHGFIAGSLAAGPEGSVSGR